MRILGVIVFSVLLIIDVKAQNVEFGIESSYSFGGYKIDDYAYFDSYLTGEMNDTPAYTSDERYYSTELFQKNQFYGTQTKYFALSPYLRVQIKNRKTLELKTYRLDDEIGGLKRKIDLSFGKTLLGGRLTLKGGFSILSQVNKKGFFRYSRDVSYHSGIGGTIINPSIIELQTVRSLVPMAQLGFGLKYNRLGFDFIAHRTILAPERSEAYSNVKALTYFRLSLKYSLVNKNVAKKQTIFYGEESRTFQKSLWNLGFGIYGFSHNMTVPFSEMVIPDKYLYDDEISGVRFFDYEIMPTNGANLRLYANRIISKNIDIEGSFGFGFYEFNEIYGEVYLDSLGNDIGESYLPGTGSGYITDNQWEPTWWQFGITVKRNLINKEIEIGALLGMNLNIHSTLYDPANLGFGYYSDFRKTYEKYAYHYQVNSSFRLGTEISYDRFHLDLFFENHLMKKNETTGKKIKYNMLGVGLKYDLFQFKPYKVEVK